MQQLQKREVVNSSARVFFGPRKGRWYWPQEARLVAEYVQAGDAMDAIYLTQSSRNEPWTENRGLVPLVHPKVRSSRIGDVIDFGHVAYLYATCGPIPFQPDANLVLNGLAGRILRCDR